MALDEFALIRRYFAPLARDPGARGLDDDIATIQPTPGHELIVKVDAVVAGVHFLAHDPPDLIARKALRVNLSDLAAKAARPRAYVLAAAFGPEVDEAWIAAFAQGLAADQREFAVGLIGGDTTRTPGATTLAITLLGEAPAGASPARRGARMGDDIWVTGTIGDAVLGLQSLKGAIARSEILIDRYRLPRPRVAFGQRLLGLAHSSIDVSDGLVADLGHVCAASGVAARIEAARVPLSPEATAYHDRLAELITGGDDYEVLFTAPAGAGDAIMNAGLETATAVARIGRIEAGQGVTVIGAEGEPMRFAKAGYTHF